MGFFDSDSTQNTSVDNREYDQRRYTTNTRDQRKIFDGGGSDYSGVDSLVINDASAESLALAGGVAAGALDTAENLFFQAQQSSGQVLSDALMFAGDAQRDTLDLAGRALDRVGSADQLGMAALDTADQALLFADRANIEALDVSRSALDLVGQGVDDATFLAGQATSQALDFGGDVVSRTLDSVDQAQYDSYGFARDVVESSAAGARNVLDLERDVLELASSSQAGAFDFARDNQRDSYELVDESSSRVYNLAAGVAEFAAAENANLLEFAREFSTRSLLGAYEQNQHALQVADDATSRAIAFAAETEQPGRATDQLQQYVILGGFVLLGAVAAFAVARAR